jgi:hypothetical protein
VYSVLISQIQGEIFGQTTALIDAFMATVTEEGEAMIVSEVLAARFENTGLTYALAQFGLFVGTITYVIYSYAARRKRLAGKQPDDGSARVSE